MLTSTFSSRARRVGFLVLSAGAIGFFAAGLLTIVPHYLVKIVIKETVTK